MDRDWKTWFGVALAMDDIGGVDVLD